MKLTKKEIRKLFDYKNGYLINKTNRGGKSKKGYKITPSNGNIYPMIRVLGKRYQLSHIIWLWNYGKLPKNIIDHIDRNPFNNKIENLREIDKKGNARNIGNCKNNKSGVKGVHYKNSEKRWIAQITINKKCCYLAYTKHFIEAVAYRLAAEQCVGWEELDSPAYNKMKEYQKELV